MYARFGRRGGREDSLFHVATCHHVADCLRNNGHYLQGNGYRDMNTQKWKYRNRDRNEIIGMKV